MFCCVIFGQQAHVGHWYESGIYLGIELGHCGGLKAEVEVYTSLAGS